MEIFYDNEKKYQIKVNGIPTYKLINIKNEADVYIGLFNGTVGESIQQVRDNFNTIKEHSTANWYRVFLVSENIIGVKVISPVDIRIFRVYVNQDGKWIPIVSPN